MKRTIGFLLLLAVLLGSAGCGDSKKDAGKIGPGAAPPAPPPGPTKDARRGGTLTPKGVD